MATRTFQPQPAGGINENILDNAYFIGGGSQQGIGLFPINQRGGTDYGAIGSGTVAGTIDRWGITGGVMMDLDSDYVFVGSESTDNCYFQQRIEQSRLVPGQTYTLSCLTHSWGDIITSGTPSGNAPVLRFQQDDSPWAVFSSKSLSSDNLTCITFTWNPTETYTGLLRAAIRLDTNLFARVIAMKLEPGNRQTLAKKVGNKWVPIQAPNYQTELARCQRYFFSVFENGDAYSSAGMGMATSGTQANFTIPTPVTMRARPTISKVGALRVVTWTGTASIIDVQSFESQFTRVGSGSVHITVNVTSGLTVGSPYFLSKKNSASARLFLSAEL